MLSNSWVIVRKDTADAVLETFQESVAKKVNTEKYEVLPAHEYLYRLNRKIKKEHQEKGWI